jgi:hypothetical protein
MKEIFFCVICQILLCIYRSLLLFIIYLYQQIHTHTHTHIYNYIKNVPTCFGFSAPSSGSFAIAFAKVVELMNLHKTVDRCVITSEAHMQPLPHFLRFIR